MEKIKNAIQWHTELNDWYTWLQSEYGIKASDAQLLTYIEAGYTKQELSQHYQCSTRTIKRKIEVIADSLSNNEL